MMVEHREYSHKYCYNFVWWQMINYTYRGEHFVMYVNVKSLWAMYTWDQYDIVYQLYFNENKIQLYPLLCPW